MFALQLLPELMIQRLAWVLVHFIWQGIAIALLLALTVGLGRLRRPAIRYGLSLVALLAMTLCPVITFLAVHPTPSEIAITQVFPPEQPQVTNSGRDGAMAIASTREARFKLPSLRNRPSMPGPETDDGPPLEEPILKSSPVVPATDGSGQTSLAKQSLEATPSLWQKTQPWIVAGWLIGVALLSLRLLLGWVGVWRLRRQVTSMPTWLIDRTQALARSMRITMPYVRLSHRVTEAIVAGFFKPMILLPIAWVTELPADMLEAVIAHELAHIRRGDLWINLLQRLVETLLFYHPAIWWLSRRLRIERELCCDELVVSVTQNRLRYAETLEHIGRLSLTGTKSMLVVSITGQRTVLLDRIRHILNLQPRDASSNAWLAGLLPLLVASVILWSASTMSVVRGSADPAPVPTTGLSDLKETPKKTVTLKADEKEVTQSDARAGQKPRADQVQKTRVEPVAEVKTITGTLMGLDGKPVPGIQVLVFEGAKQLPQTFVTDQQGQIKVPKAWREIDHFLCLVARDGQERLAWFDFFLHGRSNNGQKTADGSFKLVFLPLSRTVRGYMTNDKDQPLAGIPVVVEYLQHETNFAATHWDSRKVGNDMAIAGAVTNEAGAYELKLPINTTATLRANHPDWITQRVTAAKDKSKVSNLKMARAGRVKGQVVWRGMPVAGVQIGAQAIKPDMQHGGWGEAVTDAEGRYEIGGLPNGPFNILLLDGVKKPLTAAAHESLIVKTGEAVSADFTLRIGRRVTGRVLDVATGKPLPGCAVGYYGPARPRSSGAILSSVTNERGEFEFALPPGMSYFHIAEARERVPDSQVEIDIVADRDPEPITLKAGPENEVGIKIFVGPPQDRKVSLNARREPLESALKTICDAANVKLELDGDGLKTQGYTRNMPVVLQLQDVSLGDALKKILDRYEKIGYLIENDTVFVSTLKKIDERKKAASADKGDSKPDAKGDVPPGERRGQKAPAEPGKRDSSFIAVAPDSFAGIVRDNAGRPIPRADVVLCKIVQIDGRSSTEVIATGQASDKGLYQLELTKEARKQWSPTTQWVVWAMTRGSGPGMVQYALGNHLFPRPEDDSDATALYPERTVNLELTDEKGQPLAGEVVQFDLRGFTVPPSFRKQMLTDTFQGKLAIQHMPSGPNEGSPTTRTLRIQTKSHGLLEFCWNADHASELDGRVREGVDPIQLTTQPLGGIKGRLVSQKGELPRELIQNVQIRIETFHGDSSMKTPWCYGFASAKTDIDGRFEIPRLVSGKLSVVRAELPQGAHWRPLVNNRQNVVIKPGDTTNIDIPLIATRTLRGQVVRPTGEGIPNIEFSISHGELITENLAQGRTMTSAAYGEYVLTDASGRFAVDIIPGRINIAKQTCAGSGWGTSDLWPNAKKKIPEELTGNGLQIPEGHEPFDLPPIEVTNFKGVLRDESGKPVEGVLVASNGRKDSVLGITQTKADGTFDIQVTDKPSRWAAARRNEQGDFGLPGDDAPDVKVISETPLVLQMIPKPPRAIPAENAGNAHVNQFEAVEFSAFESSLSDPAFDINQMQMLEISTRADHETVLHLDRLCRDYGCGDLVWLSSTRQLMGLRGARLIPLGIDELSDLEDIADLSLADLRNRLAQKGTIAVQLKGNRESDDFAIESHEGHLLLLQVVAVDNTTLKVKLHRLTKKEDAKFEEPGDGLEKAVWGPITDGLQAGIAYRDAGANPQQSKRFLGELVQVKLFVRNAGKQARSYTWRRWKINPKIPVRVPLLDVWKPLIVDSEGHRALTGRDKIHDAGERRTATLQPGEAVFVGATSFSLWPAIDVGFGSYPNRQTSVATAPGIYTLSTELPTELAGSPQIRTGELQFVVTQPDQAQIISLNQLDAVGHAEEEETSTFTGWRDAKSSRRIRPAAPLNAADFQTIQCRAVDAETKQPVSGALANVEFLVWGEDFSSGTDQVCEYDVLTDAEGRFDMRIPRALLSGYLPGRRPDFRVFISHPHYAETFDSKMLKDMQELGLISKDGTVQKPGPLPDLGVPLDTTKFASFQAVALKPARPLSGRLLGLDGKPLPNIHIYGSNAQGWPVLSGSPQTDSEGRFRFNIPAKMTMKLEFRAADFGRTYVTAKPDQTDLGDIRPSLGTRIRGLVLDVDGKPVAHVKVTTPAWPDPQSQPNFIQETDDKGWFQSDVLAPGEYQIEVGALRQPDEDRNGAVVSGPPPDLYVPLRFTVKAGEKIPELTLRPATSTRVTSTLFTTVPKPAKDEVPQAIDPLHWRVLQEKIKREQEKLKSAKSDKNNQAGSPLGFELDDESGGLAIKGDPQEQQDFALSWIQGFSRIPNVTVKGKVGEQAWTRISRFDELEIITEPLAYSFKVPSNLTDVTIEPGDYVQHLQLGNGPKLFGTTIHVDRLGTDQLELKIYRYRPTTLKVIFIDAAGKQVVMKDNALPPGLAVEARYSREAAVRQAGVRFESSEVLMNRAILDHTLLHFVIPGEAIDLKVNLDGNNIVAQQITLKDGETRTIQVQLGKPQTLTEKSETTPLFKDAKK
ncbi:MAG: hypothetical protein JWM11_3480 [Planctomycetaceae bacterium]|nr:hypothetical protein [Planctomycetaceae bacterium]